MQLIILCLGLLSCAYLGECALTWVKPAAAGDAGIVAYIEQTDVVATVHYTVEVTGSTGITITQVPDAVLTTTFALATTTAPITLAASPAVIDYTASTTHVIVATATDGTLTESATITLSVIPLHYRMPKMCATALPGTDANTILATVGAVGASTITLAGTATGYTFTAGDGTIKNDAAITTATTDEQVNVITTAKEEFGTDTSVTSTVVICIKGGCDCTTYDFPSSSGASIVSAGLFSFIMLLLTKLN